MTAIAGLVGEFFSVHRRSRLAPTGIRCQNSR